LGSFLFCQLSAKVAVTAVMPGVGIADFEGFVIEQLEMLDENDKVTVEIVLISDNGDCRAFTLLHLFRAGVALELPSFHLFPLFSGANRVFGVADVPLSDGVTKDEAVEVRSDARTALISLKAAYVD